MVTLKEGDVFDSTIPGKFSTYLKFNKPILGLLGGETKNLINNNKLGYALENFKSKKKNLKIKNFIKKSNKKIFNNLFINKFFLKEKILDKLNNYFYESKIKLNFVTNINKISFKKILFLVLSI